MSDYSEEFHKWLETHARRTLGVERDQNWSFSIADIHAAFLAGKASRGDVQGGWISVADSRPGHCQVVLVCGGVAYYKHDSAEWFTISGEDWPGKKIQWEVKHWMPLPNPPSNSPKGE